MIMKIKDSDVKRHDKRLSAKSFFITYRRGAICFNYKSQHKHYIVMKSGSLRLYSTNGVSFGSEPKAMHSVIEGIFHI